MDINMRSKKTGCAAPAAFDRSSDSPKKRHLDGRLRKCVALPNPLDTVGARVVLTVAVGLFLAVGASAQTGGFAVQTTGVASPGIGLDAPSTALDSWRDAVGTTRSTDVTPPPMSRARWYDDDDDGIDLTSGPDGDYPPLKVGLGWYCDYFDGYYDSDGNFQEYSGREKWGLYVLSGMYRVAETQVANKPVKLSLGAKLAAASVAFKSDNPNGFDESNFGIQNLTLLGSARMALADGLSGSLQVNTVIDIGSEDEEFGLDVSDGSTSLGFELGISKRFASGFRLGGKLYRTNELDSDYWDTIALGARGSYPVFSSNKVHVTAGANLTYLADTGDDNGGYILTGGVHAGLHLKESPLSFKLDGGCTDEFIPTGNFAFLGKDYWQNKSVSLRARYAINR